MQDGNRESIAGHQTCPHVLISFAKPQSAFPLYKATSAAVSLSRRLAATQRQVVGTAGLEQLR